MVINLKGISFSFVIAAFGSPATLWSTPLTRPGDPEEDKLVANPLWVNWRGIEVEVPGRGTSDQRSAMKNGPPIPLNGSTLLFPSVNRIIVAFDLIHRIETRYCELTTSPVLPTTSSWLSGGITIYHSTSVH